MNVTIFGATGSIGRHLVEQSLDAGHHVVAVTRDRSRVTTEHPRLQVMQGDVTNLDDALLAVAGSDAVVVVLGAGAKGGIRERGTRTVIEAMQRTGVRRLVCQSTLGAGDSRGNLTFKWKYLMFGLLLRQAYADHQRQEEAVRRSDLDWTIVRPSAFTDDAPSGDYQVGFGPDATGLDLTIARAEVASFLLHELDDPTYVRSAVAVSH